MSTPRPKPVHDAQLSTAFAEAVAGSIARSEARHAQQDVPNTAATFLQLRSGRRTRVTLRQAVLVAAILGVPVLDSWHELDVTSGRYPHGVVVLDGVSR